MSVVHCQTIIDSVFIKIESKINFAALHIRVVSIDFRFYYNGGTINNSSTGKNALYSILYAP